MGLDSSRTLELLLLELLAVRIITLELSFICRKNLHFLNACFWPQNRIVRNECEKSSHISSSSLNPIKLQ